MYVECKTFVELSANEVYQISKLRQDVFILEQQSIYMDLDDLDKNSWHFLVFADNGGACSLAAYTRLRYLSDKDYYKIERVVCSKKYRGQGLGTLLLSNVINKSKLLTVEPRFMLSAQLSAVALYEKFGFSMEGKPYDDGGIEHIDMSLTLKKPPI
jgi:ElaA protein